MTRSRKRLRVLLIDEGRQCLPFLRALKRAGHHVTIVYQTRLSTAYFSRYSDRRVKWPDYHKDMEGFERRLLAYVRKHRPDVTLAVADTGADILSRNKPELTKHTALTAPDYDVFLRAADKVQTMAFCMENDIPCPQTYTMEQEGLEGICAKLMFPVIVKPRRGIGALGLRKVEDPQHLEEVCRSLQGDYGPLLVQEYIPLEGGTQFQAEAFVDEKSRMKVCVVIAKPRFFPVTGGTSTANMTIDRPDIQESVRKLLEGIGWTGAADVDLILDPRNNVPKILEINPRVTAGIKIGFAAGVDYADLHLRLACGEPIPDIPSYKLGVCCRNFFMDVLWYLQSSREARRETVPPYYDFLGPDVCYQTFSVDDPLPLAGFFLGMVRKYANPREWREKLGKESAEEPGGA